MRFRADNKCRGARASTPAASLAPADISCASIPGCLKATTFYYDFSIVNNYAPAVIHAFSGGAAAPALLATSPAITFLNPTAPTRAHIARDEDPTKLVATWWSPADASAGAQVRWGAAPDALTFSAPAAAATYARGDLCGLPATGMGWTEPHYWLSATIGGLVPGSPALVYYSVGSARDGWTAPVAVRAPPAPGGAGARVATRILLLADNGVTEPDGTIDHWDEPSASLTVQHLRERIASGNADGGEPYSLVVHPGDVRLPASCAAPARRGCAPRLPP